MTGSRRRAHPCPLAAGCEHGADCGQGNVVEFLALQIKQFELRAGILLVLRKKFPPKTPTPCNTASSRRNDLFPIFALGIDSIHHEHGSAARLRYW